MNIDPPYEKAFIESALSIQKIENCNKLDGHQTSMKNCCDALSIAYFGAYFYLSLSLFQQKVFLVVLKRVLS